MSQVLLKVAIRHETDVVLSRQRAKQLAAQLGFDAQDQTRLATAVSELSRNAYRYAGGGQVEFVYEEPPALLVRVRDRGPGIENLSSILDGRYLSRTGMGLGILGAKCLSDHFRIDSSSSGTIVEIGRELPAHRRLGTLDLAEVVRELFARTPAGALEEIQGQNQELLQTLEELQARQAEIERLNLELEETNRGVLALYHELDDKAESLRHASELKSRFLSNMTHELRTPLNSIIMVSRQMLLQEDGPLEPEYLRQANFILRSADDLLVLVNDLLDLAKIEAGRLDVRPGEFDLADLFSALRGMFRPMQTNPRVGLVFEDPPDLRLFSDEGKVSQVLRNFISNALKFTRSGEVRVRTHQPRPDWVEISVSDTGIGIAPEDRGRLFQEFSQLQGHSGAGAGTGLGLSLSLRLAELLGGTIRVESELGVGSTFTLELPVQWHPPDGSDQNPSPTDEESPEASEVHRG